MTPGSLQPTGQQRLKPAAKASRLPGSERGLRVFVHDGERLLDGGRTEHDGLAPPAALASGDTANE
jgi:hypothetical protein